MNESDLLSEIIKRAQRWGRHTSIEDAKSEIRPYTSAYRASLLSEIEKKVEGVDLQEIFRENTHHDRMGWFGFRRGVKEAVEAIIKEAQEGER